MIVQLKVPGAMKVLLMIVHLKVPGAMKVLFMILIFVPMKILLQ